MALPCKEVLPTLSIRELQQEVQFRSGIPAKQQLLSHAGVRLLAERSLQDFWDFGSLQLDVTSYAPLVQGPPTFLPCTEHRGIQLLQLQELQAYLVNRCRDGELRAWRDAGKPICLEELGAEMGGGVLPVGAAFGKKIIPTPTHAWNRFGGVGCQTAQGQDVYDICQVTCHPLSGISYAYFWVARLTVVSIPCKRVGSDSITGAESVSAGRLGDPPGNSGRSLQLR